MQTRPPSIARILIAVGFAISCFGLALFLWLAFGGPLPLKPEGYRFTVPFDEATQLAVESDVRISGVSVGKVKALELGDDGLAEATVEVDARYAPIPEDTRAQLREKTLLGETYVELTPGSDDAESLPEGGSLPEAQVSESVQLDEIFRAFDARTRESFQAWMQGQALAWRNRGDDFSAALGSLDPFAQEADRVLRILDSQDEAVKKLVSDGGDVFRALSERQGQLRGLISNSDAVFRTTAQRDEELRQIFQAFPTFLRESRLTLDRLEEFATDTDPLVRQLQPAAQELSPTLIDLGTLAPELESFFVGLQRAIDASEQGLPATRRLLKRDLAPLLGQLDDYLAEFNSIFEGIGLYRRELAAFLANVAASTQIRQAEGSTGNAYNLLRTSSPLGPEAIASYPRRLEINRPNAYMKPGGYLDLAAGLRSFETRQCPGGAAPDGITARLDDSDAGAFPGDLYDRIKLFAFAGENVSDDIPVPPCVDQPDFQSIGVDPEQSEYLHIRRSRDP